MRSGLFANVVELGMRQGLQSAERIHVRVQVPPFAKHLEDASSLTVFHVTTKRYCVFPVYVSWNARHTVLSTEPFTDPHACGFRLSRERASSARLVVGGYGAV